MLKENLDAYAQILEKLIKKDNLKIYSKNVVDLIHNPKNWGKLFEADLTISESYIGPCGDMMEFFLKINGDIIEKATFITDGCGATVAVASQATLLIKGKPLSYIDKLGSDEIIKSLGGLSKDHKHCAILAVKTLKKAAFKFKELGMQKEKKRIANIPETYEFQEHHHSIF